MKQTFTLTALLFSIFTFAQTRKADIEIAQNKPSAQPVAWKSVPNYSSTEAKSKHQPAPSVMYYAFNIAEPSLPMEESIDGSVIADGFSYLIAYSSQKLSVVLSDLLQKPESVFEVSEYAKTNLDKEIGIYYKNNSIRPEEAKKVIIQQLCSIYNLKIQITNKLKDVWYLSVSDPKKYATWTANGNLQLKEILPTSVDLDKNGLYKGSGNNVEGLANGLQTYCKEIFMFDPLSTKAQIDIAQLEIQNKEELVKTLNEKYGICLKKVKKVIPVIEISSK